MKRELFGFREVTIAPFCNGFAHVSVSKEKLVNDLYKNLTRVGFDEDKALTNAMSTPIYIDVPDIRGGGFVNNSGFCGLQISNIIYASQYRYPVGNDRYSKFCDEDPIESRLANLRFILNMAWRHERQHLIQYFQGRLDSKERDVARFVSKATLVSSLAFLINGLPVLPYENTTVPLLSLGMSTLCIGLYYYSGIFAEKWTKIEREAYSTYPLQEGSLFNVDFERS